MVLAKYQRLPQAPPNFNATPESLIAHAKKLIDKTRDLIDKIVTEIKSEAATFENVVLPMARDDNVSRLSRNIIYFYRQVSADKGLCEASREVVKVINNFYIESHM